MPLSIFDRREIGSTGIRISPLGFGASPLGNVFGDIDERDGIEAVHQAVKLGVNFFDVSPFYGGTLAETVLGKALRSLPRDSYVLSTKVGRYGPESFDFSAKRVTASVEESMSRLGVDHFDFIQCHDVEFGDLDQIAHETIPALNALKEAGKVRAVGITGYPLEVFPYLLSCAPPKSIDVVLSYCHYNLQNDRLTNLLPSLKRQGVGVINASPLCMGLLTDSGGPAWHPASEDVKKACRAASVVCKEAGTDLPTVAMSYSLHADPYIATTLVGIDSVRTLRRNIDIVHADYDKDIVQRVKQVLAPVHNHRWASGPFGAF